MEREKHMLIIHAAQMKTGERVRLIHLVSVEGGEHVRMAHDVVHAA